MAEETLTNFKDIRTKKIRVVMDTVMLDCIIAFIYKDSVLRTRKVLHNIATLFDILDEEVYSDKPKLNSRIWIIKKSLEAKLKKEFENDDLIKQYCLDDPECDSYTASLINDIGKLKISHDESRYLIKQIEDRLQYGYVVTVKDVAQKLFNRIDQDDFKTYKSIANSLYDLSVSIVNNRRSVSSAVSDQTFSLRQEYFDNVIEDAVTKLKDKDKMFITGIKRWNTILGPAYLSKRLYTYLALPGGGKSQVLLKSALDIKRYNGHVKAKDPNKNPAVLVITMENDIDETVERIFNMCGNADDIRNFTPKQVAKILKRDGQLTLTEENNIDVIIKYYPNRSIDTNDLYGIIKDLDDDGSEVIALVLDYLKRIRPAEKADTEKEELKNITNELKTLAKIQDIPVITAQQLNRNAASVVDAALQANKEDIAKLIGRDGIAGAWEIIENSDFVCVIHQEEKKDTGDLYLTFKLLKRRYRSSEDSEKMRRLDYFSHPYEPGNSISLIDDINLPKSLSVYSLASDFDEATGNLKRGKKSVTQRPKEKSKDNVDLGIFGDFSETTQEYF